MKREAIKNLSIWPKDSTKWPSQDSNPDLLNRSPPRKPLGHNSNKFEAERSLTGLIYLICQKPDENILKNNWFLLNLLSREPKKAVKINKSKTWYKKDDTICSHVYTKTNLSINSFQLKERQLNVPELYWASSWLLWFQIQDKSRQNLRKTRSS